MKGRDTLIINFVCKVILDCTLSPRIYVLTFFRYDIVVDQCVESLLAREITIVRGSFDGLKHPPKMRPALGTHAKLPRVTGEPRVQRYPLKKSQTNEFRHGQVVFPVSYSIFEGITTLDNRLARFSGLPDWTNLPILFWHSTPVER